MHLLIFGAGYTGARLAQAVTALGGAVDPIHRQAGPSGFAFDDASAIHAALRSATHILSSIPPTQAGDPVLDNYGTGLRAAPARWIGYLSSTGVYGDTGGAWVDEGAPVGTGRRPARSAADLAWQGLRGDVRVFRLPGIYGPGRSALDRVAGGIAQRIDVPEQVFSRIHVDDIVAGILASFEKGPAGVYNLADDLPASQNAVIEAAANLLGLPVPPLVPLAAAALSPQARAFYAENRRVASGKARRLLGWRPLYPDYRAGLRALSATTSPTITSTPPATAAAPQR